MTIDNEELMYQLQRVSVLSRRSRRAMKKSYDEDGNPIEFEHGHRGHHGHHGHHCHHGHRSSRDAMAFDNPEATHGYGNHKCKGGSGRHGQNRILAALTMQEGLSQKDLAYLLGIRPQSLSQALAKLEEDGMITRKHNEEDARVINVYLTEAGRIRAAKVAEDRKKSAADIFSVLTDEEKDQLAGILAKLSESIDAQFGERKPHEED